MMQSGRLQKRRCQENEGSFNLLSPRHKGEKSGKNMKYKIWWPFSLLTSSYEKLGLYRKFGTTNIAVALPAIVGAKMCV
jgi:hypothetical protein